MKKLFLLTLFGFMTFLGSAQVTVFNNSGEDLLVGVQYTTGGCSIDDDETVTILDTDNWTFNPPAGMAVLRVGVSGTYSDFEFSPCADCTGSPATAYTFSWSDISTYCAFLNITP